MTKAEIMNVVKNIRNYLACGNPIWDRDTVNEAMNMAIDALERTDTHECVDSISRQAAIELWECYQPCIATKACEYDMKLRELPSAQPEIIRCKDCKRNADNGGLYPDGRTKCPIQEHYALLIDGHCHLGERQDG